MPQTDISSTATELRLALLPRDGMFLKDGRGWYSSATGRARTLPWPFPSTLRGALRSAWGRYLETQDPAQPIADWEQATCNVTLAAALALRRPVGRPWQSGHRLWATPADALYLEGSENVHRLDPVPMTPCTVGRGDAPVPGLDEARERLWWPRVDSRAKPKRSPDFWTDDRMEAWLASGEGVPSTDAPVAMPTRQQVHVSLDPDTGTQRSGALFSIEVLETLTRVAGVTSEWAIALRGAVPGDAAGVARAPFALGGRNMVAHAEELAAEVFAMPAALEQAFATAPAGLRLVTVTPALFQHGWLPDSFGPDGNGQLVGALPGIAGLLVLRAAFVPRPVHVSGWDMHRRQPKATRRLVPAGSVYFFTRADGQSFSTADVKTLWLAQVGMGAEDGMGCVVPGLWRP